MLLNQDAIKCGNSIKVLKLMPAFILLLFILSTLTLTVTASENISNISDHSFSSPQMKDMNGNQDTHDYHLEKIILPSESTYVRPGRSINPEIFVSNQGGNDTHSGLVPVEAWFGDTQLIPVIATFPPMEKGTRSMYSLRFAIPNDIVPEAYPLTIKIDPWNTRKETGPGRNDNTTLSLIDIKDKNADEIIRSSSTLPSS
jgi:hypothetical protein